MFRFDMAQRVHDLVEQALAGFDFQIVRCLVVVRRRFDFRQSRLDVFLLPAERASDLQFIYPCGSISPMRCFGRVIRFVYESMIISTARRLSGVTRPVSSSTVRRSTSMMVISVISVDVSYCDSAQQRQQGSWRAARFIDHATCDEDQFVTHGEPRPPVMVYGIVNINDGVMVPFGPPNVMTAAERQRSPSSCVACR